MSPIGRLDGKAAIITGGEGSIGLATARALVAEGATVFLAGLSELNLKAAAADLNDIGRDGAAAWAVTDVTDASGGRGHVLLSRPWRRPAPRARR
jgi:NAD(P)-dependent dehydrogenase (short-subunit alcohol dehydrogenase family)